MNYNLTKLPNGLRVLMVPMPSLESATVTVWVKVGSRFESPKINGLSHFLEHMVFKGSKKRPSAKIIAESIDALGGEFNASTSKEWTNFYIKARVGILPTAFDVLGDMVINPLLKENDIKREKGVIVEEINMYEDTPMEKIGDLFENLIFKGNNLEMDIAGTPDSVRGISKDDFEKYRDCHYSANNILLTVSGGIQEGDVLKLCEQYFGGLKLKKPEGYFKFNSDQDTPRLLLKSKKNEQAHFILGFRAYPRGHEDRFILALLSVILGGGMSSRLFTEVREKRGLAYAVRTSGESFYDCGYIATYAGVDPKRIGEAVKVTLEEHYKIAGKTGRISKNELNKAKEFIKGHLALSLEDTRAVNSFFGLKELLLQKIETPEEIYEAIDKVSVDQIYRVAKELFRKETLNLAMVGPLKETSVIEKLIK